MTETSLGIDLSAHSANTWACLVEDWPPSGSTKVHFFPRADDRTLLELMARVDATGIDAPFGWPQDFMNAIARFRGEGRWIDEQDVAGETGWSRSLRLRLTDRLVAGRVGFSPLSVSADSLAVCGFRAAGLLSRLSTSTGRALDRTGAATGVYEVYPAGALAVWGLPHRGYKRPRGAALRAEIVDSLRVRLGLGIDGAVWDDARAQMLAHDHALDAFVSAVVARLAVIGQTEAPTPAQADAAREEGWIHLPV